MIIDIALSNDFNNKSLKVDIDDCICAVIDVIRATSTIAALFGSGVKSIFIASSLEGALALKKSFPERLLCGETDALRPEGFDYGNSPLEFSRLDLAGREAILKTTNGTVSFLKAEDSPAVYSLAPLNFTYTMDAVLGRAMEMDKNILLICSGQMGRVAYDDTYIAGMAIKYMLAKPGIFEFSDSAKLVLSAVLGEKSLSAALAKSISAASLKKAGLGEDLAFCSRIDDYNLAIKADNRIYEDMNICELKLDQQSIS